MGCRAASAAETVVPHRIGIKQRCATSWLRRVRYRLSRLAGARLQKSQRIYLVDVNGHRFKRTIQPDSYAAVGRHKRHGVRVTPPTQDPEDSCLTRA